MTGGKRKQEGVPSGTSGAKPLARNKKGIPVYSHQDIREQYCINEKELQDLESSRRKSLFGCLNGGNEQSSPCRRKSLLLPACLRSRSASDENIYKKSNSSLGSPSRKSKQSIDYENEDYFKRRPQSICYTDPKRLASLDDSLATKLNSHRRLNNRDIFGESNVKRNGQHSQHNALTTGESNGRELMHTFPVSSPDTYQRSAYTQPNTPNVSHSAKIRNGSSMEANLDERDRQKHVSFQQKSSSASTPSSVSENSKKPILVQQTLSRDLSEQKKSEIASSDGKLRDRLIDGTHHSEFYDQKALDQLLAPVLTKALMQEKIKRSCVKTQATQTDTSLVMKSLPHIPLSPKSEKSMISQAAQTNGSTSRRKRLVKSLSEAAKYEGSDYEIYDLDDVPPPPPPPSKSINQVLPLYPKEHSFWNYPSYHSESFDHSRSEENSSIGSFVSEPGERCECCTNSNHFDDEMVLRNSSPLRDILDKELSEDEMVKSESGASSLEMNIKNKKKSEAIQHSVECSLYKVSSPKYDSKNKVLRNEVNRSISSSPLALIANTENIMEKIITDNSDKNEQKKSFISTSSAMADLIGISFHDSNLSSDSTTRDQWSPLETIDHLSSQEFLDNVEESISDSQITVLQKLQTSSTNGGHEFPDTQIYNIPKNEPKNSDSELFSLSNTLKDGSEIEYLNQEKLEKKIECQSDLVGNSSPPKMSIQNKGVESRKSSTNDNHFFTQNMEHLKSSKELLQSNDYSPQCTQEQSFNCSKSSSRRLTSPESDSSGSHLPENRSSHSSPSIHSNVLKSESSRKESRMNADQSVTSEDYLTANESITLISDSKNTLPSIEKDISLTKLSQMLETGSEATELKKKNTGRTCRGDHENEDLSSYGFEHPSDFETAQDLTSPEGDTTTSASYQIDLDDKNNSIHQLDNISCLSFSTSPAKQVNHTKLEKPNLDKINLIKDREKSETKEATKNELPKKTEELYFSRKQQKHILDSDRSKIEKMGNENSTSKGISLRKNSLHEEAREKLKSEMKLDFTPNVTAGSISLIRSDNTLQNEDLTDQALHKKKHSVSEFTQTTPPKNSDKIASKPRRPETRIGTEVSKKTDGACTPGMVRSPAMHEGFRLEDWTPIRTPGTPELFLQDPESKDLTKFDKSKSHRKEFSPKKEHRRRRKHNEEIHNNVNTTVSNWYNEIEPAKDFHSSQTSIQGSDVSTSYNNSRPYSRSNLREKNDCIQPYISNLCPPQSYYNDGRRRSGEFSSSIWMRHDAEKNDGHLLGTCDHLRKAESFRSFTPTSDNVFLGNSFEHLEGCRYHLCSKFGQRSSENDSKLPHTSHSKLCSRDKMDLDMRSRTLSHRTKSEERSTFITDWGVTGLSLELGDEPISSHDDDDKGQYTESYLSHPWLYVSPNDELLAWKRDALPPPFIPPYVRIPGYSYPEGPNQDINEESSKRSDSPDSTCSEREFRTRYQAITHRLIHRKASLEMHRKIICGNFRTDKTLTVGRDTRGEFGFRIHGSRPVVVSAIETATPAEISGLEIGDIIISINDINILEVSHSDVVRLAHSGNEALRLTAARTCDVLIPMVTSDPTPICAGYLYKIGGSYHNSTSVNSSKKWHRRWFALKKDHCLYYYKSEVDQTPLGALHLMDYSVHALNDCVRPSAFTVAKFGGLTWHLSARTDEARNRWGQMITKAAQEASHRDELLEETKRRLQQSPGAIATPDCFGYLLKLSPRWYQWKKMYCVLKDACLFFYSDTDATVAIGVVCLHGYRVQSTTIGGRKYAFELLPPDPKFRHFYFHTDSENDKKRWLAGLEYSIERWIKVE